MSANTSNINDDANEQTGRPTHSHGHSNSLSIPVPEIAIADADSSNPNLVHTTNPADERGRSSPSPLFTNVTKLNASSSPSGEGATFGTSSSNNDAHGHNQNHVHGLGLGLTLSPSHSGGSPPEQHQPPSPALLDVPSSTSPRSNTSHSRSGSADAGDSSSFMSVPPSPTLSTRSSVHFATSLALRDNKPEESSGMGSLGMLHPNSQSPSTQPEQHHGGGHGRKNSTASAVSFASTEPDSNTPPQTAIASNAPSPLLLSPASAYTTYNKQQRDRSQERSRSPNSDDVTAFGDDADAEGEEGDADGNHSRRTSMTLAVTHSNAGGGNNMPASPRPSHTSTSVDQEERALGEKGKKLNIDDDGRDLEAGGKEGRNGKDEAAVARKAGFLGGLLAAVGLGRKSVNASSTSAAASPSTKAKKPSKAKAKAMKRKEEEEAEQTRKAAQQDTTPFPRELQKKKLTALVDPKSLESLTALGGDVGVLRALGVRPGWGIPHEGSSDDSGKGEGEDEGVVKQIGGAGAGVELQDLKEIDVAGDGERRGGGGNWGFTKATMEDRKRVYDINLMESRKSKTLFQLMWNAFKDQVLILLTVAAVISLALGLFQDFGTPRESVSCGVNSDGSTKFCTEPPVDWVEGVAIMVAVTIVVMVGSVNDYQKEKQFKALNDKKDDRTVKVIRSGNERVINIKDVVVGDIALLEPGEIAPCDGIFLSGHNVKIDESDSTGESDAIKKVSYSECMAMQEKGESLAHTDCFILSGSKVLEGVGAYVVIAVGENSFNGKIIKLLRDKEDGDEDEEEEDEEADDDESKEGGEGLEGGAAEGDAKKKKKKSRATGTPLQMSLNHLANKIAKIGTAAGLVLFIALFIRYAVQLGTNNPVRTSNQKGIAFVQILIIAVTVIVVAVPEGLPLAVTIALAFATKRMTKENLLVRVLGACETMANASVVCTDKTGTLTQNSMTVVAGSVGIHAKFVQRLEDNRARTNAGEEAGISEQDKQAALEERERKASSEDGHRKTRKHPDDFSIDQSELNAALSPQLARLFNEAIAVNSTAFEDVDEATGKKSFVGSKTETALLNFAKELGWAEYHKTREAADIVQMIPFSSERKSMGVVVKVANGKWRVYFKGASEILTKLCTKHVVVHQPEQGGESAIQEKAENVETGEIDALSKDNISRTIIFYANQMLRTIAICYRDLESWPPAGAEGANSDEVPFDVLASDLTLVGIVGIEDPLREGVREAVASCQKAGVAVKMCTGDNVLTARSIALQCGIFTQGGIIMEGPVFRSLTKAEQREVAPRLQVLARSSPTDKYDLVKCLQGLDEIVGVTGDGTNDGPALRKADVGFAMGITGTEVAKEASDIVLMDDNFASIVKAIMWGRCVNDSVRKFLQFQISVNITAVVITFVTAVASASETSALSAVQLLWINIIMDTFAALALATDPASPVQLKRMPEKKDAPLFTVPMIKQILGQSFYQTIVILVFHFAGNAIFGNRAVPGNDAVLRDLETKRDTLVFNAFVFAQIFNSFNSRRIDNKLNIFEGIMRNRFFIIITLIEIGAQVLIVFVGSHAFQVSRINGRDWGISLALGIMAIPIGALIRLMPDAPFERFLKRVHFYKKDEEVKIAPAVKEGEWNSAIKQVGDNLQMFGKVRGGRVRGNSFVAKSRKGWKQEKDKRRRSGEVQLSSIMTMVPTLIVSSVGAGWSPQPGKLSDPTQTDPSRSSSALWEGKVQIHPDTPRTDPAYRKWGGGSSAGSSAGHSREALA